MMTDQETPRYETKPELPVVDELFALDFDRTLADSTRLNELLFVAAEMANYDLEDLKKREIAGRGNSFNTLAELKKVVDNDDEMAHIKEMFLALTNDIRDKDYREGGFMEPRAQEFLQGIPREHRMILTYGTDAEWQTWKLEAAGLADDYHIIATGHDAEGNPLPKPQLLASLYRPERKAFVLNGVTNREHPIEARHITIVDDKIDNLTNLPDAVRGVWYVPWRNSLRKPNAKGKVLLEQLGWLPERVKIVRKLSQSALRTSNTRWPAGLISPHK